jgi:hypothetical protein
MSGVTYRALSHNGLQTSTTDAANLANAPNLNA